MSMMNPWHTYFAFTADSSAKRAKLREGTTKRIFQYAKPFQKSIFWYLLILVAQSLLIIAQPLLFLYVVDTAIPAGDKASVVLIALLIAAIALVDGALGIVGRWLQSGIGEGLIYHLRTDVFNHVQTQSIAFFTRAQTGALISRINGDVIGAQRAFTSTLGGVVGNVISLVIVLATMIALSWEITIAAILMLPVFLVPAKWIGLKLQGLARDQTDLNATMSAQMAERFNVSGALLMKLFGNPARESASFAAKAASVRDIGINIAMANSVFFTAMGLVGALATALVYGMGGWQVIASSMTLGTLLALTALLGRIYGPMAALANVRVDVMTALVSFERVFEVLDLKPLVTDHPDARTLSRGPNSIEFADVTFRYPSASEVSLASLEAIARPDSTAPEEIVLQNVSFTVPAGSMTALVGPSGAGKSTTTHLVARLFDVIDGRVLVGGQDVRDVTSESLHAVVGVVAQDSHMFHESIRANLLYAHPEATEEQIWQACEQAQIASMIRELPLGLDTVVGDRGYRLSGGEKQRLAIARLLLKAPDVVVLDEATAHLDSENEALVQEALSTALKGRTSLVVAHRLSTIRSADQILVFENGSILERGTHDELLAKNGLYADLYHRQFADVTD